MTTRLKVLSSSIATKILIAVTGLALLGFLVLHMVGNLLALVGPHVFNAYSDTLVRNPLLIPAEIGLLLIFALHVYNTVVMWFDNRRARPVGYQVKRWARHTSRKSVGSTTMIVTGLVTLGFVVFHVMTFKYGPYYEASEAGVRDLYRLLIEVFRRPAYVGFYVACMVLIGLHLRHGIASACQSLGIDHPRVTPFILKAGWIAAVGIGAGFALIPLWVYLAM